HFIALVMKPKLHILAVSLVVQFSKNNHLSFVSAVCLSGDFYNISRLPIFLQVLFFNFRHFF
ncbi:hypothetical protein J2T15_005084, partial [Paenibacillus harenae]|nr:hypothetical protein [Paenibacillus harenae]MDQ0115617.1 hypothetical protein [Paenibacillus harenae]